MSTSKRISSNLDRDLYVLEDPDNPRGSVVNTIYPSTILDQVFDDQSPTNKTLREIIEDLRYEILTGGRGDIKFPVTSVNGMTEDVVITKNTIGLGLVDNSRDIDKPLSNPQRSAVESMIRSYDFKPNLDDLYNHIKDTNNPHKVTLEELDKNSEVTNIIQRSIQDHSFSKDSSTHPDIRDSLARLWNLTDSINTTVNKKLDVNLNRINTHYEDPLAHLKIFNTKENIDNKSIVINDETNEHTLYPSNRAVVEYVAKEIDKYNSTMAQVKDWIDSIYVIDDESQLPNADAKSHRKCYFIRNGKTSHDEIAICIINPDGKSYRWDITSLGTYSKFNPTYFTDSPDGMSINMITLINQILDKKGYLAETLEGRLDNYYTKDDIEDKRYLDDIKILTGTIDGTIRYYTNNNRDTMSQDVMVAGIKRLAFLESVTENEIKNQSIYGRHIISKSIESRHIKDGSLEASNMNIPYGSLIGNITDSDNPNGSYVSIDELAATLKPFITGVINPSDIVGPTWQDLINKNIMSPQAMEVGKEYTYSDGSCGMRFKGKISSLPNMQVETRLSTDIHSRYYRLVDAGGTWEYQSEPSEWTILGGSNITGHTFATVNLTKYYLELETISTGDRRDAEYDIWVKYIKIVDF